MIKKYFLAAAVILIAASCTKQQPASNNNPPTTSRPAGSTASSTPPDQTTGWNSYMSPTKYGFSIKYPEGFGFSTDYNQVKGLAYIPVCDQNMVACAYIIRDTFKATNLDGAGVSINIDPALNSEAKCYNFNVAINEAQTPVADVTINGTVFKSATGGGGAAGHYDKLQVYRDFHNNQCYEIAQDMVETQIANYPAGTVQQVDETVIWDKLQSVVNTFEFTNESSTWLVNNKYGFRISYPASVAKNEYCESGETQNGVYVPSDEEFSCLLNGITSTPDEIVMVAQPDGYINPIQFNSNQHYINYAPVDNPFPTIIKTLTDNGYKRLPDTIINGISVIRFSYANHDFWYFSKNNILWVVTLTPSLHIGDVREQILNTISFFK